MNQTSSMNQTKNKRINLDRLRARIERLGAIGRNGEGGIDRVSLTEADMAGRAELKKMMEEAGLVIREDAAGNLFGRREGTDAGAAAVLSGSHIDTVPNGGMFDGALGVLAALEVIETLRDRGVATRRPVEVVSFTDEEGVRFRKGLFGSRAFVGASMDAYWNATDADGMTLEAAVRAAGLDPARVGEARREQGSVACFIELHPEQGRTLELAEIPLGIVEGIVGIRRVEVRFTGMANHAGTTSMDHRHDALLCASELALAVESIAREAGPGTVGTVGRLQVEPNAANVVPGVASMTVEFRALDGEVLAQSMARAADVARTIAGRRGAQALISDLVDTRPVPMDTAVVAALQEAARTAGVPYMTMPSGAGHDSMVLAGFAPTAMLFVPSRGGISHNPAEWTEWEHVAVGAEVLLEATLRLAEAG